MPSLRICFKSSKEISLGWKKGQNQTTEMIIGHRNEFFNSLRWPIYIFHLADVTKLPHYPHRRSTTVSLETFTLNSTEMIADYGDGGQKMLDIMAFNKSLKITWIVFLMIVNYGNTYLLKCGGKFVLLENLGRKDFPKLSKMTFSETYWKLGRLKIEATRSSLNTTFVKVIFLWFKSIRIRADGA